MTTTVRAIPAMEDSFLNGRERMTMDRQLELLSPAGSYDAFIAAVSSGCDAVYLGARDFGARAHAKNFTREELAKAVETAHLLGVKVYCTVNTLFKNSELPALAGLLDELYMLGVDAFIIQDLGLAKLVQERCPYAELHASTQMNCHSPAYAAFLKEQGFSRVVLSRELSLGQIRRIHDTVDVDLEAFVHGALCYCFSGQCLMSSMIGGRSGNRGRCAQPCRLPYQAAIDGVVASSRYLLSPKDIQTVDLLPKLIDAGVASFKIEGRMKSPEYVAWNTLVYRRHLDLAAAGKPEELDHEELEAMMQLYNRGGFSSGYLEEKNGAAMMAVERPNHQGIVVGRVLGSGKKGVRIHLEKEVHQGDALLVGKETFLARQAYSGECVLKLNASSAEPGSPVYRLKDVVLENRIREMVEQADRRREVAMEAMLAIGRPARLRLASGHISVEVEGDLVQAATGTGMDDGKLAKPLKKLNDTPFKLAAFNLVRDEGVFMPVSQLNSLRREAVDKLASAILSEDTRLRRLPEPYMPPPTETSRSQGEERTHVLIAREDQFDPVLAHPVHRIYFELGSYSPGVLPEHLERCRKAGVEAYIALPRIVREEDAAAIRRNYEALAGLVDGFLARSMDGYLQRPERGLPVVFDHTANIMNIEAWSLVSELPDYGGWHPSLELNRQELAGLATEDAELLVYGCFQVMTSQQCPLATLEACRPGSEASVELIDRKGSRLQTERYCRYCQNNIYNPQPMMLLDRKSQLAAMGYRIFRYRFTREDAGTVKAVLDEGPGAVSDYTRGHYQRGVQ